MKTWIKGGLWGLGTGIFLEIISAIGGFICTSLVEGEALVCLGILFLPILPVFSLLGTFLDGNLLTVNSIAIISIVLYLIIVFIIGALIALIIQKIKSKNNPQTKQIPKR